MMKKIVSILVIIILIAFGYYFYQQSQTTKQEPIKEEPKKEVIKIGAILPLTGKLAVMGEYEKRGMKLAQLNAEKKGKLIDIIFEDSKSNTKDAVNAINKLINIDKVDILISSTTGISLAIKPIAVKNKKNLVTFCMDSNIANANDLVSRFYIGIKEETNGVLEYFKKNINNESIKVGILYAKVAALEKTVNNSYIPYFDENHIDLPFIESYDLSEKDFDNLIIKMKQKGINHLILLGYGFEFPNIYKSLVEQKILKKLQVLGGWGFLYTTVDKELLEGTLVSGPSYLFEAKDKAHDFIQAFNSQYKLEPNFDAAFAYEAIRAISENVKYEQVLNPIEPILINKDTIDGIIGKYYFDIEGNMIVKTGLGKINNGILRIE